MFAETSGSRAEHDEEKLNLFLEEMLEKGSGLSTLKVSKTTQENCPILKMIFIVSSELSECPKQPKSLHMFKNKLFTVSDGTVAAAPGKQKELWQLRERIAEALLKVGEFFYSRWENFVCSRWEIFSLLK